MSNSTPKVFASGAFRIIPLPTEIADAARRVVNAGVADHALITVDSPDSSPCRHCLRWAQPGERVILFPYAAIPAGHPYSETGPIFVHADGCQRYSDESRISRRLSEWPRVSRLRFKLQDHRRESCGWQ